MNIVTRKEKRVSRKRGERMWKKNMFRLKLMMVLNREK